MRLAASLLLVASIYLGPLGACGRCDEPKIRDFGKESDPHRSDWFFGPGRTDEKPDFETIDARHGESLVVPVAFPQVTQVWRKACLVGQKRRGGKPAVILDRLEYDVYVPAEGVPPVTRIQARLLVKDKDGYWFEALGLRKTRMPTGEDVWEPATALHPGWNTIRVDLSHDSVQFRPCGHQMRWSRAFLARVEAIGFAFQGNHAFTGALALDSIKTWTARDDDFPDLRVVNLEASGDVVPQYGRLELTFEVNRPLLNPFHTGEIDIMAEMQREGREQALRVPAFCFQDFRRWRGPDAAGDRGLDRYMAAGPAVFKVRFTPRHAGAYRYRLQVKYRSPVSRRAEETTTGWRSFAVEPRAAPGFVRISQADPHYFEFENGAFFFPVGHSFRSPTDPRHVREILRRDFADFAQEDIADARQLGEDLARAAYAPPESLRGRIWQALPGHVQEAVCAAAESGALEAGSQEALLAALNRMVRTSSVFERSDYEGWEHVWEVWETLHPEAHQNKIDRPKHRWRQRRNRALIELCFPRGLRRTVTSDHGLRNYERIFPQMAEAGVNALEVWMCSWWVGLEWTGEWKHYHGLGRYNLLHAWKLDRLIRLAEKYGLYVHLVIDNHGKAAQHPQYDHEWEGSPYNKQNARDGGFLANSTQLFLDGRAKDYYRDKLRYIAARYGWSTHIYGMELWSELDLIGHKKGRHHNIYASPAVRSWHQEMIAHLERHDHGDHIITTHYSGDYTVIDRHMVEQPFIDYTTCDAYHNPHQTLVDMLVKTEEFCAKMRARKPFMVTEYGGFAYAAPLANLQADLYGGLWWSWMSRTAGVPFYWWYELIELEGYYEAYQAFSRFIQDEDKRSGSGTSRPAFHTGQLIWRGPGPKKKGKGKPWKPRQQEGWPLDLGPHGKGEGWRLSALLLANGRNFYAYVYDHRQLHVMPADPEGRARYEGVRFAVLNIPGTDYAVDDQLYQVEVWDCWSGEVVQAFPLMPKEDGSLAIDLPPFVVHAAIKIKPADSSEHSGTAASSTVSESTPGIPRGSAPPVREGPQRAE